MIVCPDDYLCERDGRYEWTQRRIAEAWARADAKIERALRAPQAAVLTLLVGVPGAGKSTWLATRARADVVYLDATNTERARRAKYVELAATMGKRVEAVVFLTEFRLCLARNAARCDDRRVPVEKMLRQLERLKREPVMYDEGFDCITVAVTSGSGQGTEVFRSMELADAS